MQRPASPHSVTNRFRQVPPRSRRSGTVLALLAALPLLAGCDSLPQFGAARPDLSPRVADAARVSGAPELALHLAETVLEREPSNIGAMVAKGDALYAMGKIDAARRVYRAAAAIDRGSAGALLGLGRTIVRTDPVAAETAFRMAIAKEPGNASALNNLGIALDLQGRHADAQQAYRQSIAVEKDTTASEINLGMSLAVAGHREEALQILRPIAADPDLSAPYRRDLASALNVAGDSGRADMLVKTETETAIAQAPQVGRMPVEIASVAAPEAPLVVRTVPRTRVTHTALPAPAAPIVTAAIYSNPENFLPSAAPPETSVEKAAASSPHLGATAGETRSHRRTTRLDVQLASLLSEEGARSEWRRLQRLMPDLLADRTPVISTSERRDTTYWRLATAGFASRDETQAFCARILSLGGKCLAR